MTKELEVYFANYFEMFRSEGWKQLLTDLNQNVAQINSVELTTDNDNLHFRKGQLAILATLFNLEAQIQNAEQEANEPVQDDLELEA
jgi:hypothetical protein|tara:strand:- start:31 stop:291 length:261 start_codon:yes stop_codon:yes gene_type:complete